MSKAGSDSSPSIRTGSGRGRWLRSPSPPSPDKPKSSSSAEKKGKRFIDPYRLNQEQREALLAALEESGVGDADSRILFIGALEYDLAGCSALAEPAPASEPVSQRESPRGIDASLADLGRTAQILADQLARLGTESGKRLRQGLHDADRFSRSYGDDYLCSLQRELEKIAAVVHAAGFASAPEAQPKAAVRGEARRFVLRAADAFADCFELTPTSQRGAPFVSIIKAITTATGIRIPTDHTTLADILRQG